MAVLQCIVQLASRVLEKTTYQDQILTAMDCQLNNSTTQTEG